MKFQMSPLKNMAAPSPAETHAHEMHEKAGSIPILAHHFEEIPI